jgi:hypothetical protein
MDKEALERWKLELEIANLRKPWYKNLEMWKVIIPAVAIVLSLIYTFSSGWINIEKSKLELKKEKLNKEIDQFSQKSDSISKILMLKDSLVEVSQLFIDSLEKSRDELISMVNLLKFKDNLTAAQIDSINNLLINERRELSKKVKSLEFKLGYTKSNIETNSLSNEIRLEFLTKTESDGIEVNAFVQITHNEINDPPVIVSVPDIACFYLPRSTQLPAFIMQPKLILAEKLIDDFTFKINSINQIKHTFFKYVQPWKCPDYGWHLWELDIKIIGEDKYRHYAGVFSVIMEPTPYLIPQYEIAPYKMLEIK